MTDYNIEFKDHVVENPNRFRQTVVAPGIVDLVPLWIENPTQVIQEGTPVNADLFEKLRANVTRRSETYTATANQTVFDLTKAYMVGQGRLDVYISGVKQRSGIDFTETSPTSFTLSEGLEAGTILEAVYFSASQALSEDLIEQVQAAEAATLAANDAADDANDAATGALTANLNWKEPVNNLTALNALASPQTRDTRQTKDTGYVYRYDGTAWVLIQTMDPNAINALDTRLTSQLADKASQTALSNTNTDIDRLSQQLVPKRYVFGKQLEKLKYALSNPLEQFTGIALVGDSITWGLGATGNPADYNTGRDGTLSDIRDNYASLSWANELKRYIGKKYMGNVSPTLTNWAASPSGQAIATFVKQHILYPYGGDFTTTNTGTIFFQESKAVATSLSGFQFNTTIESGRVGETTLSFLFTGESFTLSFDSVGAASMDYELFVDGVSQGVYATAPGGSVVTGSDNRRVHAFPYVRNKLVEIKTRKTAYVGYQTLRIGGLIIDKTVRITNQGIIGTKAYYYKQRNMTGNTRGDGVAVDSKDNFIFCQLGSNDRLIESTVYAKGSNEFKKQLKSLTDELETFGDVILMIANPAANESPTSFSFNMQDARNVVYRLSKEKSIDFIDNYSIFGDVATTVYTTDGLHPNDFGYKVIARNIINALEFN